MPFIENCSRSDIKNGLHSKINTNTILIQISDIDAIEPKPLMYFREIYNFRFEDTEKDTPGFITDEQAYEICSVLRNAMSDNRDIIVHCHAGLCRSGAVVEAALHIGFNPVESRIRYPNSDITVKLLKTLETIRE